MKSVILAALMIASFPGAAAADQVSVRRPQGWAHGFVEVTTLEGKRIGVGDLLQRARGNVVTSRLLLNFLDGSVDDETTIYRQGKTFDLISDHHIQHGPSFPESVDTMIDVQKKSVRSKDSSGLVREQSVEMPADVYNGMASTLLMNLAPSLPDTEIAIVLAADKPRVAHLVMKKSGERAFMLGGIKRMATEFTVHVELGGVAGVVAPIIGKQPPDYHVLIVTGTDPAFIREEGPLFVGGPIWRVQQISAVIP